MSYDPDVQPEDGEVSLTAVKTGRSDATAAKTVYQCTINQCAPYPGGAVCVDLNVYLPLGSQVLTIRYYSTANYPNDTGLRQISPGDMAWSLMEPANTTSAPGYVLVHTKFHNRSHNRDRAVALEVDWQ